MYFPHVGWVCVSVCVPDVSGGGRSMPTSRHSAPSLMSRQGFSKTGCQCRPKYYLLKKKILNVLYQIIKKSQMWFLSSRNLLIYMFVVDVTWRVSLFVTELYSNPFIVKISCCNFFYVLCDFIHAVKCLSTLKHTLQNTCLLILLI